MNPTRDGTSGGTRNILCWSQKKINRVKFFIFNGVNVIFIKQK